ncbi:hypothetical protein NHQ30_005935 [Ciborinia camelliae]|nr:hypothetical protein NHQ30_005935 [Ciborinia camelliae]
MATNSDFHLHGFAEVGINTRHLSGNAIHNIPGTIPARRKRIQQWCGILRNYIPSRKLTTTVIGTIGKAQDLTNEPRIFLSHQHPPHGHPSISLNFLLHRQSHEQSGLTHLDQQPETQTISFNYHCSRFRLAYKLFSPEDLKTHQDKFGINFGPYDEIICIRFMVTDNKLFHVSGLTNGALIKNGPHHDMYKAVQDLTTGNNSHTLFYYTKYDVHWIEFLHDVGKIFGCLGQGTLFPQYTRTGESYAYPEIVWDVDKLRTKANDHPSMHVYPQEYRSVYVYDGWPDFSIRHFFGVSYETLWILQYAELLRNTPILAQFCGDSEDNVYYMSFILPSLSINGASLFTLEASVFVHFSKGVNEQGGWEGTVIDSNRITHPGSHLMLVTRSLPGLQNSAFDVRASKWSVDDNPILPSETPLVTVFLQLGEPIKVMNARVSALAKWAPQYRNPPPSPLVFDDPSIAFNNQTNHDSPYQYLREIFYGHGLQDHRKAVYRDLTYGLSPDVVTTILTRCGYYEKKYLPRVLKSCLFGFLLVVGPAGTGKTTLTIVLIELALTAGKKVLIVSPSECASANICSKMTQTLINRNWLHVRLHSKHVEHAEFLRFIYNRQNQYIAMECPTSRQRLFGFQSSLAQRLCEVADLIPTTNFKVQSLKSRHIGFKQAIHDLVTFDSDKGSNKDVRDVFNGFLEAAAIDILTNADTVTCTTVSSTQPWLRRFLEVISTVMSDEAGCITTSETLITLRPGINHVLVGDANQIPPYVGSTSAKYLDCDRKVNPFAEQVSQSVLGQLQIAGFPVYLLRVQYRIERGLSIITDEITYHNLVQHPPGATLSQHGIAFKTWSARLSGDAIPGQYPPVIAGISVTDSPPNVAYPILFDLRNSFSYIQVGGTSIGNTYSANLTVALCENFLRRNPNILATEIAIITPYLQQVNLLNDAVQNSKLLHDQTLFVTTDSFQGREQRYIFYDLTLAKHHCQGTSFKWVSDKRRLTVALTRHMSGLVIIADCSTFSEAQNPCLTKMHSVLASKNRILTFEARNIDPRYIDHMTPTTYYDLYREHQILRDQRESAVSAMRGGQ